MEIHAMHLRYSSSNMSMQIGGLNDILKALLDNNYNKSISNQELTRLLQKIENDAAEINMV
jgi:hypothetical protein